MEYLNTALLLLAVGLSTVFVVLLFLVLSGNVLIRIVNRYIPEESVNSSKPHQQSTQNQSDTAIRQAIDIAGNGKWRVISIEKLTN